MVDLNPVLSCLRTVEEFVTRGESVRDGLKFWLVADPAPPSREAQDFRAEVLEFLRSFETDDVESPSGQFLRPKTVYRENLFQIFQTAFQGQAVLQSLKELRTEFESQLELDMKSHVDSLPLKMLIPLLLCMFPAFLILLLGPITRNFLEALK